MYKIQKLSNKITVVSSHIPYVKSVSLGVWVKSGTRFEDKNLNGMSHFIEHMLFKGTSKRSAKEIAHTIDIIGGRLNAFTTMEYTAFYTHTLDSHINISVDVLSDMIKNSLINQNDVDMERKVIIEEIAMCDDNPDDVVHELISKLCYDGYSLGMPILGTVETLNNITPDAIRTYMNNIYSAENIVISVAGNFDENTLIELLENNFSQIKQSGIITPIPKAIYTKNSGFREKDIGQMQFCMSFEGVPAFSDDVYALNVFNTVLGANMSSRLFQRIREQAGLVYDIAAFPQMNIDTGMFIISGGTNKQNYDKVKTMVIEEIDLLKKDKLNDEELHQAKEQLKGSCILANESVGSRMQQAGRALLFKDFLNTDEQILAKIDAVNHADVAKVIDKIFDYDKLSIATVGN